MVGDHSLSKLNRVLSPGMSWWKILKGKSQLLLDSDNKEARVLGEMNNGMALLKQRAWKMTSGSCVESTLQLSFLTPNAFFLISEILILNRWYGHLLKTFKPRKQAVRLISNHHYHIWLENSLKYKTFLSNFFLNKSNIYEGPSMCFLINEKWFLLSKGLGLGETEVILPCQFSIKTKTKSQWGCLSLKKKESRNNWGFFGNPIVWSLFLHHWGKKIGKFLGSNLFPQRSKCSISLTCIFPQNM